MTHRFDVAIIGLGAMGSAAACELAGRGLRVLGLEQFDPGGHALGSSHGESRIYRQAYFEGSAYVPMLVRAHERWRQLEADTGQTLFMETGGLFAGRADSALVSGSLHACRAHGLDHELLDAAEIRKRWPLFHPPDDFAGLHERAAGYVHPERTVKACQDLAAARGAELHFRTTVSGIHPDGGITTAGDTRLVSPTCRADRIIVTAGPWTGRLLPGLAPRLSVRRVLMHWFRAAGDWRTFTPERYPVHAWELPDGTFIYGPTVVDGRIKLAFHNTSPESECDPDSVDREVRPEEIAAFRAAAEPILPGLCAEHDASKVCLYTVSPDEHFIIDRHPEHEHVLFAAGFSGHGFKFTPVIGEVLADLATNGESVFDLSMFRLAR